MRSMWTTSRRATSRWLGWLGRSFTLTASLRRDHRPIAYATGMREERPDLPAFIIGGAAKGGTSTLHEMLGRRPDVFIPDHELYFFSIDDFEQHPEFFVTSDGGWMMRDYDGHRDEYLEWYRGFFRARSGGCRPRRGLDLVPVVHPGAGTDPRSAPEREAHLPAEGPGLAHVFAILARPSRRPRRRRLRAHAPVRARHSDPAESLPRAGRPLSRVFRRRTADVSPVRGHRGRSGPRPRRGHELSRTASHVPCGRWGRRASQRGARAAQHPPPAPAKPPLPRSGRRSLSRLPARHLDPILARRTGRSREMGAPRAAP